MATSSDQDRKFLDEMVGNDLLERTIEWIQNNLSPDDVFDEVELVSWAERNVRDHSSPGEVFPDKELQDMLKFHLAFDHLDKCWEEVQRTNMAKIDVESDLNAIADQVGSPNNGVPINAEQCPKCHGCGTDPDPRLLPKGEPPPVLVYTCSKCNGLGTI